MAAYISLVLTESNVDTANNQSTVTAKLYYYGNGVSWSDYQKTWKITIDGTTYSGTNTFTTSTSAQLLGTASKVVTHNDNGAKTVTVSASFAAGVSIGTLTTSKNITLTTISRLSSLTVGNGTLGTAQTMTISEPTSGNNHKIKYACGDAEGYILGTESTTSSENSVSWTPPLSLAAQNTTGTSVAATITLYTFNSNGALVGSKSYSITLAIPASVKPTLTIAVSDPTGYSTTYGGYVQSKSKIKVVPSATIAQGAAISSYKYTIGGVTYNGDTAETSVISTSGDITVYVKATDTRGRYAEVTQTVTALAYSAPSLTITKVERTDSGGTADKNGAYLTVYYDASITSLSSNNKATLKVKTKKKTDASYDTETTIASAVADYSVSGGKYTFAADTASSYDVMMTLSDSFNVPVQRTATGSSCTKVFSVFSEGKGFAVGKVAERENKLEVGWDADFNGALSVAGATTLDGDLSLGADAYDKFNKIIGNGLAKYKNADGTEIDPDTTTDHLILTNLNTPMGGSYYMYIHTVFTSGKSESSYKAQYAIPYNRIGSMYHRYYDGTWSEWRRHVNADEFADYVVEQGSTINGKVKWTYEKWASGKAEMWGYYYTDSFEFTTPQNGWYVGAQIKVPYPFTLYPDEFGNYCYPSVVGDTANRTNIGYVIVGQGNITVLVYNSVSATCYVKLHIRATGRWK